MPKRSTPDDTIVLSSKQPGHCRGCGNPVPTWLLLDQFCNSCLSGMCASMQDMRAEARRLARA